MISSPGWKCRIGGESGSTSTRDWIISRPGTVRSWRCRLVRHSPGANSTAVLGMLLCSWVVLISASLRVVSGMTLRFPPRRSARDIPGG